MERLGSDDCAFTAMAAELSVAANGDSDHNHDYRYSCNDSERLVREREL